VIGKLVSFVVALAAAAAAASVLVVSAAYAFYALVRTYLGPAGAAACVTLAAAVVLGALAFFMFGRVKGPKPKARDQAGPSGLVDRLTGLVSDRPVVAASAAVAAGLLAWRNPTLVSTLLRMAEARPGDSKRR
jgi:hypothetical protein